MKKMILLAVALAAIGAFIIPWESKATITILRDAGSLSRGTLPNPRHDASSVTLQGNAVNFSTVASGVQNLWDSLASTKTAFYNYTSTADVRMNLFNSFMSTTQTRVDEIQADLSTTSTDIDDFYTSVNSTRTDFRTYTSTSDDQQTKFVNFRSTTDSGPGIFFSTANLHDGNTNYMDLTASTDTKVGGAKFGGTIFASSGSIDAVRVSSHLYVGKDHPARDPSALFIKNEANIHQGKLFRAIKVKNDANSAAGNQVSIELLPTAASNFGSVILSSSNGSNANLVFIVSEGFVFGSSEAMRIEPPGNIGIGTVSPQDKLHIFNGGLIVEQGSFTIIGGSITIRGANAGLTVRGGSITIDGTFISTTGFVMGGSTFTTTLSINGLTYNFPSVQGAADQVLANNGSGGLSWATDATGGGGGGNNQAINTSTGLLVTDKFSAGGAIFLATSPFVAIPGKVFNTSVGTFNVVSIQGFTMVVSTALDANVTMRIIQSTSPGQGFGDFSPISSSATVTSSSDTVAGGRYGVEYSTSFKMFPRMEYSLWTTSVPAGGAPPAENYGINVKGWWSP